MATSNRNNGVGFWDPSMAYDPKEDKKTPSNSNRNNGVGFWNPSMSYSGGSSSSGSGGGSSSTRNTYEPARTYQTPEPDYSRYENQISDLQNQVNQMNQYKDKWETWKNFDTNQFKTQTASIEDIAKKYGFDYSREYAKRQAESERQAKQDGLNETKKSVNNNVIGSAEDLDHNYFQKYMNQAQGLSNNGLNGGIAADQNLRLSMNRQAQMGDIYRDANAANFQLNNALGRLDSEALAREDSLYNERRQQGFQNALADSQFRQSDNLARLQAELSARGQDMDMSQFNQNYDLAIQRLQEQMEQNDQAQSNWEDTFDWSKFQDTIGNLFQDRSQDFAESSFWSQLSGYMPDGSKTLNRENTEFRNELAMRQFEKPYSDLTAAEKANLDFRYLVESNSNAMDMFKWNNPSAYQSESMSQGWYGMMQGIMEIAAQAGIDPSTILNGGQTPSSSPGGNNFLDMYGPDYLKK